MRVSTHTHTYVPPSNSFLTDRFDNSVLLPPVMGHRSQKKKITNLDSAKFYLLNLPLERVHHITGSPTLINVTPHCVLVWPLTYLNILLVGIYKFLFPCLEKP